VDIVLPVLIDGDDAPGAVDDGLEGEYVRSHATTDSVPMSITATFLIISAPSPSLVT
jgi:hypothetical protein